MSYKFLEHTADVKFLAEGKSIEEVFVSCGEALNETIRGDISILEQEEKSFEVEAGSACEVPSKLGIAPNVHLKGKIPSSSGKDNVSLLYNFLEEFLFLLDAEDFLISKIKSLEISGGKLKCVVGGDRAENYKFTNDVKAITYSEMFVTQKEDKWEAQVVLDV